MNFQKPKHTFTNYIYFFNIIGMKKGGFKKKFDLKVECEEDSNLASSIYSEIGPDGLRFLKYDIKVGKQGLTQESNS
jgi:hypothetical protein